MSAINLNELGEMVTNLLPGTRYQVKAFEYPAIVVTGRWGEYVFEGEYLASGAPESQGEKVHLEAEARRIAQDFSMRVMVNKGKPWPVIL